MIYRRGIDIIVVGYHQPADCRGFHDDLLKTTDSIPWDATYVSVEANDEDVQVGDECWGDHHFPIPTNVGHAGACNAATPLGDHDTIFYCNADTRLPSGVLDRCYDTLWSDPSFGTVGPRQVDESGRITAAGIFGTLAHPQHRAFQQFTNDFQDLRTDAVIVSGALFMVKRHVFDELASCPIYRQADPDATGAMPSVKHYWSESFPCYHMTVHGPPGGYKCIYEGRVTARHDWHKASPQGGWGEIHLERDRALFRRICEAHGLEHD